MKYEIKNDKGQTKWIDATELPKYGVSAPQAQKPQFNNSAAANTGGLMGMMGLRVNGINDKSTINNQQRDPNMLGDLFTPTAASNQRKMNRGQNVSLDERAGAGGDAASLLGGLAGPLGYIGGQALQGATKPGASIKDRAKNAAVQGGTAAALAGAGKLLPYATKGGVVNKTTQAAEKATAKGASTTFDELSKQIESKVYKELGQTAEVKKSLQKFLSQLSPAELGTPKMSPSQLLTERRQMAARGGKGWLQKALQGDNIEDKVGNTTKRVISDNVHKLAPGTKTPDKLYNLYSKGGPFGGDIPHLLLKYGATALLGKSLAPSLLKMIASQ